MPAAPTEADRRGYNTDSLPPYCRQYFAAWDGHLSWIFYDLGEEHFALRKSILELSNVELRAIVCLRGLLRFILLAILAASFETANVMASLDWPANGDGDVSLSVNIDISLAR